MKKFLMTIMWIFIFFIILILCGTFYINGQNEFVTISRFGKIVSYGDQPGIHLKVPFIQSDRHISKAIHQYDISPSSVITRDKKSLIADSNILWIVVDPKLYTQTLGANERRAMERVEAAVYNSTKNCISSMTQEEMLKARGEVLSNMITEGANKDVKEYGIKIVQTQIKAIDLPADNKEAVYNRMISERNRITAAFKAEGDAEAKKIRNEADKSAAVIIAEANLSADIIAAGAEAEYMEILRTAYGTEEGKDLYLFLRSIEAMKGSLTGGNKTLVIDKDSVLGKLFYSNTTMPR